MGSQFPNISDNLLLFQWFVFHSHCIVFQFGPGCVPELRSTFEYFFPVGTTYSQRRNNLCSQQGSLPSFLVSDYLADQTKNWRFSWWAERQVILRDIFTCMSNPAGHHLTQRRHSSLLKRFFVATQGLFRSSPLGSKQIQFFSPQHIHPPAW